MDEKYYEQQLIFYATLYKLLGVIEITLRRRIPTTLRKLAIKQGVAEWYEVIPPSANRERVIDAIRSEINTQEFEVEFRIPFSFWRYLFSKELYSALWIPSLFNVFPNFKNSRNHESYRVIGNSLHRAYLIRNRVAHYDFKERETFEIEAGLLIWLIAMLDVQRFLIKSKALI
jgi:hypothetical protein